MMTRRSAILAAAGILGLFSIAGTGLVTLAQHGTAGRIAENQRQTLLHTLQAVLPPQRYDNDILADVTHVSSPELDPRRPVAVYRARQQGAPVAAVLEATAPDGYSGEIRLLVAIKASGELAGVRVLSHKETPGLGDPIEDNKSDWILRFTGLSLQNPSYGQWKVKRDGGAFDQFTGATITPRAVVKAVFRALQYFDTHKTELFDAESTGPGAAE
ncbi:electron transport complex subunit RsxG [Methyloterricola oryzae]|uniref:electron transport complex subunit RsxG n=1 Tax=Methyloterricola oryzae TaxID=1495050 RepID=UPI0009E573B1|nr:electron transport complex subunit RsxG [Methyloterricola oryzae]